MIARKTEEGPASWEISFNRVGVPVKIEPGEQPAGEPRLSYLKPIGINASELTRGQIAGRGEGAHLTTKGKQFMRLLIFPD